MSENSATDPAAIFCCAVSLRDAAMPISEASPITLSDAYSGWNGFLQEVMRVATLFETWATAHVAFDHLGEVWPYFMEDRFGTACVEVSDVWALAGFDKTDCLRIAQHLQLPLFYEEGPLLPLEVRARNPVAGSAFTELGIQTLRYSRLDEEDEPFRTGDDPWEEDCDPPCLALCGISAEGQWEPIARLATYREARSLAQKLAPGIDFPEKPVVRA